MLSTQFMYGQQQAMPDCVDAIPLCDASNSVELNQAGIGSVPEVLDGCLFDEIGPSNWMYIEFDENTPPNATFTISVNTSPGGVTSFDLGFYGPNVSCDDLGNPSPCLLSVTGGQVASVTVNANEGYFFFVDNVVFNGTSLIDVNLGGVGAGHLNCVPPPPACSIMVDADAPVTQVCENSNPFPLTSNVASNQTGNIIYEWISTNGATDYLSDPTTDAPIVTIPAGFTGTLNYSLSVTHGNCTVVSDPINIQVTPLPVIQIDPPGLICSANDPIILNANPGSGSGIWGGVAGPGGEIDPSLLSLGLQTVTYEYTDGNGCTNDGFIDITVAESPTAEIIGDVELCQREIDELTAILDGFGLGGTPGYTYEWSTPLGIDNNQTVFISEAGPYRLIVTDDAGCTAEAPEVVVDVLPDPQITIFDPGVICGSSTSQEIIVGTFEAGVGAWDVSTGVINDVGFIDPSILGVGFHEVTYSFTSNSTGCANTESLMFEISPPPTDSLDSPRKCLSMYR